MKMICQRMVCLLLVLAGFWGPAAAAGTQLVAPRPVVWKDFLGVNAHFLWFSPSQYQQQIDRLKALGLQWVRVDLHWDRLEPAEGRFDFQPLDQLVNTLADDRIKSVFYLVGSAPFATSAPFFATNKDQYPPADVQQFADAMGQLAERYPAVNAWQIWNEPNLPAFWQPLPSPAGYRDLLAATEQELQRTAPGKTVVVGGMAYYSQMPGRGDLMLEDLARLGALGNGVIVAYHPYSQTPESDQPGANDFILRARQVNQALRGMHVAGIWATEWGWSSYAGPVEEQPIIGVSGQADYLLRRLALMSALDYDRVFLFALSDLDQRASVRDRSYGLLDLAGNPKPAYFALQNFLRMTGPVLDPDSPPVISNAPADLYSVAWRKPDGTHVWMYWGGQQGGSVDLAGITSASLCRPMSGACRTVDSGNGSLHLPVSAHLKLLEWR